MDVNVLRLSSRYPVICIMGPTAAGKTPLAIELVQRLPCEIVSVDSAMVYRGMDIGTAKPDPNTLKLAPHKLIDICDPSEAYSAGRFRQDALQEIENIQSRNKIPLLVGGTMMYFNVLQRGLATLPTANADIRQTLQTQIDNEGLEFLYAELLRIDIDAAKRIHPNDSQRIQRALEVYALTGKTMTAWQAESTHPLSDHPIHNIVIAPADRAWLHARIALRFEQMLKAGFVEEVEQLYHRGDLSSELPSIRSVGYRQGWDYLAGDGTYEDMREKAIAATRQLAKRQLTWLRSWNDVTWFESREPHLVEAVREHVERVVVG